MPAPRLDDSLGQGLPLSAALALAWPAQAQPADRSPSGVIRYNPDFFRQAQPQNALDMVQRVPAFTIAAVSTLRGYAGSEGNVLIDGKQPATKSEALTDVLTRIPASSVERIELIRGGAPGIDMGGRTVVVNVVLRRDAGLKQSGSANAWMFPDGRVLPGFRYDISQQLAADRSFELTIDSNGTYIDGWGDARRVRRTGSGDLVQDVALDIVGDGRNSGLRGNAKQPMLGGTLQWNGNLNHQSFADRQLVTVTAGEDEFTGRVRATNGEVSLNYDRALGTGLAGQILFLQKLGTGVIRSDAELAQGFRSEFRRQERDGESILRARLTYEPSDRLELDGGAEAAYNFLEGRTRYREDGQTIALPLGNARVEELRGQAFGQASWKISDRLSVELNSRLELSRISLSGDARQSKFLVYPKPRLALTWSPRPTSQLRLKLERVVGQLSFSDFIASAQFADDRVFAGNSDLEPQSEWILEAAAKQRFWDKGAVTLTVRHRRLSDAIDYVAIDEQFEAIGNIGTGRASDAALILTAPLDRLALTGVTLRGNGTWRSSRVIDPLTGERRRISGQRPFEGSIGFTHDLAQASCLMVPTPTPAGASAIGGCGNSLTPP